MSSPPPAAPRAAASPAPATGGDPVRERLLGGIYAFSAYFLWGFLPLYFLLLLPTGPWEIVALRILLSFVFCLVLLTVLRVWPRLIAIVRQPRLLLWTAVAGALIYANWQVFLIGALSDRVLETSLGYFINPIATVMLGVLVLRERLRMTQWIAIAIAVVAVVVIVVGYGHFPWISLTLAASFALYGLVKKQIGPSVDAISGLTLESMWLLPVAIVQLVIVGVTTGLTFGAYGVGHALLLGAAGIVTATPLLLFASAARRSSMTVIGLLQFVAPILQFIIGVWVMHEAMTTERWIGFGLVWVALVVLMADSVRHARRGRAVTVGTDGVAALT